MKTQPKDAYHPRESPPPDVVRSGKALQKYRTEVKHRNPLLHLHIHQEPAPRPSRHPDTRTSYDILNHVPKEKAHSVALIYPNGEGPEVLPQKVVTVEGGKKPHSHLRRDVDVLSNRRVHFPACSILLTN